MADLGSSIKGIWMKGMEAIGNTASNIATSTKSKVDEMNLVNRRVEILKDFSNKAYSLWQKGEHFPEELEEQLRELEKLDVQLNDLRAERLAGVKTKEAESAEKAETKAAEAVETVEIEEAAEIAEDDGAAVPVIQVEQAENVAEEAASSVSDAINDLFDKVPTAEEAAGKVNSALDSLEEGLRKFSDRMDEKIDDLSDKLGE